MYNLEQIQEELRRITIQTNFCALLESMNQSFLLKHVQLGTEIINVIAIEYAFSVLHVHSSAKLYFTNV